MSDDKSSVGTTNNLDGINKDKILISIEDFRNKHTDCVGWIFPLGGATFLGSICIIPYAMKSLTFLPLTVELRLLTGLLSAIPISYTVMKRSKERCEKRVENTYYYRIKK